MTHDELEEIFSAIAWGSVDDVKRITKSKTHTALQVGLAKALLRASSLGDVRALDLILNRMVGKAK